MSQRKALARLYEELTNLETFDRLHDLAAVHDSVETKAYALRQIRRLQITAEIEKVKASRAKYVMNRVRMSSGIVLLFALMFASLRHLLR